MSRKAGDYCFFFWWRSDAFFFDVNGNFNHMQFTGDDFLDKDVCSIVVELPNSALGNNQVGIWRAQRTKLQMAGSRQIAVEDRCKQFSSLEKRRMST
jgi:hypothetical protein